MDRKTLATLPIVRNPSPAYARLIQRGGGGAVWSFLVMPDQIRGSAQANYRASGAIATTPNQIYQSTTEEIMIPSLNLSTEGMERSLTDHLQSLKNLTKNIPGKFSPPVLTFVWGESVLLPRCVLRSCDVVEQGWFPNSLISKATVSITLLAVPKDQVVNL